MRTVEITAEEYAACRRPRGSATLKEIIRLLSIPETERITKTERTDNGVRVTIEEQDA